ncbi:MAG: hypothetical protein KJO98_09885, partial [Rhodothermia bacterium]|nr:hypothetical protein [Rhodothermia bacterium]
MKLNCRPTLHGDLLTLRPLERNDFRAQFRQLLIVAACLAVAASACSPDYRDAGSYRIVAVTDGLFGLRCQPRTELYYVNRSSSEPEPVYLGTCGTPRFVTEHLGLPHDPSCYAVSEGGTSLVYFHKPKWCGAGDKALRKEGGVYLHSVNGEDGLLYSESEVGQIWS